VFAEEPLGWRLAARDDLLQRGKVHGLVGAVAVEALPPGEAAAGKRVDLASNLTDRPVAERRRQRRLRDRIAKPLPLRLAPVLDELPRAVERGLVVEKSDPERRQR